MSGGRSLIWDDLKNVFDLIQLSVSSFCGRGGLDTVRLTCSLGLPVNLKERDRVIWIRKKRINMSYWEFYLEFLLTYVQLLKNYHSVEIILINLMNLCILWANCLHWNFIFPNFEYCHNLCHGQESNFNECKIFYMQENWLEATVF